MTMRDLLKLMVEKGASDLHLVAHAPPKLRIDGQLIPIPGAEAITPGQVQQLCYEILDPKQKKQFEEAREFDSSLEIEGLGRARVNLFWQQDSVSGAFRAIPFQIPTPETLGIPKAMVELTKKPRGLVLVTGPTGSGKSTTLASLIDLINSTRSEHIITVEDPIEFVHQHKKSIICQREIGRDSTSFKEALKYLLRQDPNVIMIGEMRDLETIAAAITISETGHLVFATLHTNTAVQTINRIIDVFPPHQQPQIKTQISFILEGILSQQLLPKTGGGRVLAAELLLPTLAIRNLIREDKIHQIQSQMEMGQKESCMQTMNQALADLVKRKLVTRDLALGRATDPEELKKII